MSSSIDLSIRPQGLSSKFGEKSSEWFDNQQLGVAACVPEEGTGAYETLFTYGSTPKKQAKIPRDYFKMPVEERDARTWEARNAIGDKLVILGHHYQRDEVIQFADFRGDSYKLSQEAATQGEADYILFCGVHFMAESADVLGQPHQQVILPNMEAGCSMADMAKPVEVEACWAELKRLGIGNVVPVTYMNSAASLKAFCGKNGGIVCTSSNAERVYDWAFDGGERILFFPDEHLGRNTGLKKGIPLDKMVVWDPFQPLGGNTEQQLRDATVILWKGYCSVHARFTTEQIATARAAYPDVQVIVHPECDYRVVQAADYDGSTEKIINTIRDAPDGTTWAVGTEINLVNRLQKELPGKKIFCLDPVICPCSTMYRVHPAYVLWSLEHLARGEVVNRVEVDPVTKKDALIALERMLLVP
ncbi:MAG: quinolinate synthase NadA [Thermomicrobiales bacterium]